MSQAQKNRAYKKELLEMLVSNVRLKRQFAEKFRELFGGIPGDCDACLYQFAEKLVSDQIRLIAAIIGDTKDGLEWFIYENECGEKGMQAGIDGEDLREIRSIDDYLWLVELDSAGSIDG